MRHCSLFTTRVYVVFQRMWTAYFLIFSFWSSFCAFVDAALDLAATHTSASLAPPAGCHTEGTQHASDKKARDEEKKNGGQQTDEGEKVSGGFSFPFQHKGALCSQQAPRGLGVNGDPSGLPCIVMPAVSHITTTAFRLMRGGGGGGWSHVT